LLLDGCGIRQFVVAFAHGLPLEVDPVGVVYEPVEDGVGEGGVADDLVSVLDGYLAGNQGRTVAGAVIEQLQEIAALLGVKLGQSPVVEDDEVGLGEARHELGEASVAVGEGELLEEPGQA
jgi:hypothetical protein